MNKTELKQEVEKRLSLGDNIVGGVVDEVFNVITEQLKNKEKVVIQNFGTFETKFREEREGRNPATGESLTIQAQHSPVFKPNKALKELVK